MILLDSVAAIFLPTSPDFPIPDITTRPLHEYNRFIASTKECPSLSAKADTERLSISRTSFASFIIFVSSFCSVIVTILPLVNIP